MQSYELTPINRQSFYGKAIVNITDTLHTLTSYNTDVASYDTATNKMTVKGWYSHTTARHINAFLRHHGFCTRTKQEMDDYNCNE